MRLSRRSCLKAAWLAQTQVAKELLANYAVQGRTSTAAAFAGGSLLCAPGLLAQTNLYRLGNGSGLAEPGCATRRMRLKAKVDVKVIQAVDKVSNVNPRVPSCCR